jgi:hypothetical protein
MGAPALANKIHKFSRFLRMHMWETRAVELSVRLPRPVAAELEEVQRRDPELLSRMLFYTMTRRTIFDQLAAEAILLESLEPEKT